MTLEERKERERKQKEWVKSRLECTVKKVYENLVTSIKDDVDVYKKLSGKANIEITEDVNTVVTKINDYGEKVFVCIAIRGSHIEVSNKSGDVLTVVPRWDRERTECLLLVDNDDTSLSYPQISKMAIGSLLFGEPV